jgi:FkbM family methyltransferase
MENLFFRIRRWTSAVLPRLQSTAFLGSTSAGAPFFITPSPANKTFAGSLDYTRLAGNEDAIVLFAEAQTSETNWSIDINQPLNARRATAYFRIASFLGRYLITQGLAVVRSAEGVFSAVAAADITSAPIALVLTDDRAFLRDRQKDSLLAEAIDKTTVAFSTSAGLCAWVQTNLGKKLWFLPAWLQPAEAEAQTTGSTNHEILTWIFDALKDGFPSDEYLQRSGGGTPADLDRTVPFADPAAPKSLHWSMHAYFKALYRLAQTGYRPEFIFDVGASTGYWSHVASRVFPNSRFYLIEPLLDRYQQRDNNVYSLHPEFITVACAAGDKNSEMELNISPDLYSSSFLDGPEGSPDRLWNRARVTVKTLDEISSTLSISGRGLLKIDVQFAEHLVLDGATRFLEQVDVVCIELSLNSFATSKTMFEMITKLHDLGFEYFDYAGSWRNSMTGRMIQQDTVFIRSSSVPQ